MNASRSREPRRVIVDVAEVSSARVPAVEFLAPSALVTVELDLPDADAGAPGQIAGVEGIGTELFFDSAGRLSALELSPPRPGLRVQPATELRAAVAAARPGVLVARELPTGSLGGVAAAFSKPFGAALFVLDAADAADRELVELADGVVAGVSRVTGTLQSVWVDGFDSRQRVLGDAVSTDRDGPAFMEALNAIHLEFLTGPAASFARRARPLAARIDDPRLGRLTEVYERIKAVDAAVDATRQTKD